MATNLVKSETGEDDDAWLYGGQGWLHMNMMMPG